MFIIDVSQSVEHDHPYAFDFLRADITHVDEYFAKRGGVRTLGLRRTFEWIVRPPHKAQADEQQQQEQQQSQPNLSQAKLEEPEQRDMTNGRQLTTLSTLASGPFSKFEIIHRGPGESDEELMAEVKRLMQEHDEEKAEGSAMQQAQNARDDKQSEAIFRQAYIPQTLNEVFDPERDIDRRNEGKANDLIYANVIGVEERAAVQEGSSDDSGTDSASDDSESDGGSEDGNEEGQEKKAPRGHKHEDKEAKKVSTAHEDSLRCRIHTPVCTL